MEVLSTITLPTIPSHQHHPFKTTSSTIIKTAKLFSTMMTMAAAVPQAHINGNDSDSDDSDVAFAYMDFGGVDFGDDDDDDDDSKEGPMPSNNSNVHDNTVVSPGNTPEGETTSKQVVDAIDEDTIMDIMNAPHTSVHQNRLGSSTKASGSNDRANEHSVESITIVPDPNFVTSESDQLLLAIEKDRLLPHPLSGKQASIDDEFGKDCANLSNVKNLFNCKKKIGTLAFHKIWNWNNKDRLNTIFNSSNCRTQSIC